MFLSNLVAFIALIFLCVQAYRARDIRSDFSEARGVALALFSSLQATIITTPTQAILDKSDVDANHMLQTMAEFVSGLAMLLFIFGPLVAHHRASGGRSTRGGTRISGMDTSATGSSPLGSAGMTTTTTIANHHCEWKDEEDPASSALEMEVLRLRSRIAELEGSKRDTEVAEATASDGTS